MSMRRKPKTELGIVEVAVDPADVDRPGYPVRLRLTRPLTPWEAEGLAVMVPGLTVEGDVLVLPDTRFEEVAREHDEWVLRLERARSLGDELQGASWMADQRRVDRQGVHGSHLRSQQADDRGLH